MEKPKYWLQDPHPFVTDKTDTQIPLRKKLRQTSGPFVRPPQVGELSTEEEQGSSEPSSKYTKVQYPDLYANLDGNRTFANPYEDQPENISLENVEEVEEMKQSVIESVDQVALLLEELGGTWPAKALYPKLQAEIDTLQTRLLADLDTQSDFILGKTLKNKQEDVTCNLHELRKRAEVLGALATEDAEDDKILFKYFWKDKLSDDIPVSETEQREKREQEIWETISAMSEAQRERLLKAKKKETLKIFENFVDEKWEEAQEKIFSRFDGKWPSAECEQLASEIGQQFLELQVVLKSQKEFLAGKGPDQNVLVKTKIKEFRDTVDLLYTTIRTLQEKGQGETEEAGVQIQTGGKRPSASEVTLPQVEHLSGTDNSESEVVQTDVDSIEGLDHAKLFVRNTYQLASQLNTDLRGIWPNAEYQEFYDDIRQLQLNIIDDIRLQNDFLLDQSSEDVGDRISNNILLLCRNVDDLTTSIKAERESGWDGTAYEATPKAENKENVLDAREFETFKQRIHRRQKDIDEALKYFESNTLAPEHQHYLDDLATCRKAITDIVVAGLEEGKAQAVAASDKVYGAELVTRAEPYLSQITDIMYAIEDLYAPRAAEEPADVKASEPENVPVSLEPDPAAPEEGPLVPLAPAAAVITGVPPHLAAPKAPEPAPAATPEKTLTPEQQAIRDNWLAARKKLLYNGVAAPEGISQETSYKDPTAEEVFEALLPERKLALARNNLWKSTVAGDGSVQWDRSNPDTFANRYDKAQTPEERSALFTELDAAMATLTTEQSAALAKQELEALSPYTQFGYWLDAKTSSGEVSFTDEQVTSLLEEAAMQSRLNATGLPDYTLPTLEARLAAATDEAERALILQLRDKEIAYLRKNGDEYRYVRIELERKTPEARTAFFTKGSESEVATEVPLQNQYQNELTEYYEGLKTEGSGFQRFRRRAAATFGFKPELPPELDATREAMFDATVDYTQETRKMLKLREESGRDTYESILEKRKKGLLQGSMMRSFGRYDEKGRFISMLDDYQAATTPEERAKLIRERDQVINSLSPEEQQKTVEAQLERMQRRYEKMLARSVLLNTFDRQLDAQTKAAEDLAYSVKVPEALKKKVSAFVPEALKKKVSAFVPEAIKEKVDPKTIKRAVKLGLIATAGFALGGGLVGGGVAVLRSLGAGAVMATAGTTYDKWQRDKIEKRSEQDYGKALDKLAAKLNAKNIDTLSAKDLAEISQELNEIYKRADASNRARAAGLIAIAFGTSVVLGATLGEAAEAGGLVRGSAVEAPAGNEGAETSLNTEGGSSIPDTTSSEAAEPSLRAQAEGAGQPEAVATSEGNDVGEEARVDSDKSAQAGEKAAGSEAVENLKAYEAKAGDNMWDVLEGQTKAGELPFMDQVDPDKLQGLLKEVELKLDADDALRTGIGFGESAHDLGVGDTVNLERLNQVALEIAKEKGILVDANVAESAAADATSEADEGATADATIEQTPPLTAEAAIENAIATAEKAADNVKEVTAPDGTSFTFSRDEVSLDTGDQISASEGASLDVQKGAEQVKAYAAVYEGGPLAFERELVRPYVVSTEGEAGTGFLGLFKTPPPPSCGGYDLLCHVPVAKLAELNALPEYELMPVLREQYHVENIEQFNVWLTALAATPKEVFDQNNIPSGLTLADVIGLKVINSNQATV